MSIAAITNGNAGLVRLFGRNTGFSALTVGVYYYWNESGLTTTATAVFAGVAIDTDELLCYFNVLDNLTVRTMRSFMPMPIGGFQASASMNTGSLIANTTAKFFTFHIPVQITFSVFEVYETSAGSGTIDVVIYSEDGQTQVASFTFTVTGSSGAPQKYNIPQNITLPPGNYIWGWVTNGGADSITFRRWEVNLHGLQSGVGGCPVYHGTKTVTAGTMPTTVDPTVDITTADDTAVALRFDN
jgi:hypothetical protein